MAAGMRVDELARVPLSYPTYAGMLVNVAASAAHQLNLEMHPAAEGGSTDIIEIRRQ